MLSINIERFLSQTLKPLLTPKIAGLFVLGLGAGLPLLMIFSSLSLWLKQAGVSKSEITFFSWAALGYGFKYIWAPLIDRVPFPVLGRMLGQRRGWMLVSQCAVMLAMIGMASIDPQYNLLWMALFAVMLGFSSATQDIVIDAYRIECADPKLQGLLAASYIAGYRLAMIISGAGLLWLVSAQQTNAEIYEYGAWKLGYLSMAAVMLLPMVAVFFIKEPAPSLENNSGDSFPNRDYMRFVLSFVVAAGVLILVFRYFGRIDFGDPSRYMTLAIEFVRLTIALIAGGLMFAWFILLNIAPKQLFSKGYVMPVKEFFSRYSLVNALLILCAIGLYRAPDIIMGTSANIFYDDLGFTLDQIATISKTFGL
ncbi:MAG: MFS transporter, partial [Alphaproteobacteria bacterium]